LNKKHQEKINDVRKDGNELKPIRLSMTAFGPYKSKEVIDFTQLKDHHLFVISGATGAGKTTIFDGICFALYGSASGSDRENTTMLRSHFAHDDVHTAVELIFELKGQTYRVLRQLGHTKKGNKTRTGEKYEFFEYIDGKEVPSVDRQMVSEINDKMEQLIGLTQDQFKQIVMLPQGEFRKLLTSESENKEAILRRLFKTERYQQMNHLLKDRRDEVEQQFRQEQQMLEHYMKSITSSLDRREDGEIFRLLEGDHYQANQIISSLAIEEQFYEKKVITEENQVTSSRQQLDAKQQAFYKAQTMNERLNQLAEKKTQRETLEREQAEIKQKEQALAAAERASKLLPYEAQVKTEQNDLDMLVKRQAQINKQLQAAATERENVLKQYEIEEKKATEREQLKQQVNRLCEFLPKVQEIESTKQTMKKLHVNITEERAALERVQKTGEKVSQDLEASKQATKSQDALFEDVQKKHSVRDILLRQYQLVSSFLQVKKKQQEAAGLVEKTEKAYQEQKRIYDHLETSWLENQAVMLATHLHDDTPCPVCGSNEHPNKATTLEKTVTKETLDKEKLATEKLYAAYNDSVSTYRSYEVQLEEKNQLLIDEELAQENMEQQLAMILKQGKEVKEQITSLETTLQQIKEQKEFQHKLENQLNLLVKEKNELDKALQERHTTYTSLKATFMERIRDIPEEMQVLEKLEQTIVTTEKQANELEKYWQQIQDKVRKAEATYITEKTNEENKGVQVKHAEEKLQQVKRVFHEEITKSHFLDEEAYQAAKLSEAEQTSLREAITSFKETIAMLDKQIAEWTKELVDTKLVDVQALEIELQAYKEQYEKAMGQLNHAQQQLGLVKDLQEKIVALDKKTAKLEEKFATISDVYDVMRGQNSRKISFERYVQIDYLDQITEAANERFRLLSNGQFYLIRSDRQEAYGKQSGLAMDVYDAYTGQTRDVKTLSGGEKFIASLSLALGMADVIQRFQGSISMDTMFIDEGFGSLDEESLYKAVDALINIQKTGRMIGVISHVEELKTIFPAMLEVEKTKEGYSKTKFVIK